MQSLIRVCTACWKILQVQTYKKSSDLCSIVKDHLIFIVSSWMENSKYGLGESMTIQFKEIQQVFIFVDKTKMEAKIFLHETMT